MFTLTETSQFRSVAVPSENDVKKRVRNGLNLLVSDNVNSNYVTSTTRRVLVCNEGCLFVRRNGWKINI